MTTTEHENDEIIEWRPWPRDPRYTVGSDGTVIGAKGSVLKPGTQRGRKFISKVENGRHVAPLVAAIVCETFHGPRPTGMETAHEDGNSLNDRADNLTWKTHKENEADKVLHGTHQFGVRNSQAKLTEERVREFHRLRDAGETQQSIAEKFGVSRAALSNIERGITWSQVR